MRRLSYFVWLLVLVTFTLSPLITSRKLKDKNLNEEAADNHSEAGLTEETAKAEDEANAGVFGFTFSPFTFLFGSDTDDEDNREEKEGIDDVSEENAEGETEKEALEEEKGKVTVEEEKEEEKEAVEEDKEVTDANEKESSVYSEDKEEIEDEDEKVLNTHAEALDESDIADNDKNKIQKSVSPAEADDGTTEVEEYELGSDHDSKVRGRENADKAIDAANTDITHKRKSPLKENTDKEDLNTLHNTIEESSQGEASEVFIENEDDLLLETVSQSETVHADSGSQKEATDKTTKYTDTKEKKARKSSSDTGRNYTNLILVNSLKPMKPHSRRHHEKHHHLHLTNDVLPEVSGPASGKKGHFKSEKTKVDNSSLMQGDPRFCQPPMPMMDGLDRYMKTCENCLMPKDSYECPMSDTALDLKKWMTELQELLSFGCQNGDTYERDSKCCHRKDPAMERAMNEMTELVKQVYTTFKDSCNNCPRNGGWTEWCEWSGCSVSCGDGTRSRYRKCNNPSPKNGGRQCEGPADDSLPCTGPSCCINGNWSPWSPWGGCGVTCGAGMQDRSRTCSNPPPNYCGLSCPGSASDMRPCDSGVRCCIPQDGNWTPWSPWSDCSASCGPGMRDRSRTCSNPQPNQCGRTCFGPQQDMERCDRGSCCVNGNWGPWEPWSQCSASCGAGMRDRIRRCDNPPANYCGQRCPGRELELDSCDTQIQCDPVCEDGNWGSWQPWSTCSATCGSGIQSRFRRCDSPSPNFCGQRCPGDGSDTQPCESGRDCCVDGNWGAWGPWSRVSVTCGVGQRDRSRRCDSPSANYCGRPCPGLAAERDEQDTRVPCCVPQDGNWAPWSPWSACSATCGPGLRDRSRTCSNPQPNQCGRTCPGPQQDVERCTEKDCCVDGNWGAWGPWSRVSVTCGVGQRDRSRRCDSPSANYCGRPCPGLAAERDEQDTRVPCCFPLDGNWTPWSPWSACSATCGPGMRDRSRTCSNPQPNQCGRTCPGPQRDSERCTGGDCCVDGNWSQWETWSACSETCGVGTQLRERTCSDPPVNYCGKECMGPVRDTRRCNEGECCVPQDGNWAPWSQWTDCSATCGPGTRDRSRSCNNPAPNRCGRTCAGPAREMVKCDMGSCCVDRQWSAWSRWSPCDVTCGRGTRSRDRTCQPVGFGPDCGNRCPGQATEREACPGLRDCGPVCEPWSACSATCAGFGTRERRCTYQGAPGTIGASRVESERCQVFSPECPALWGQWEPWCPCGCNNGRRSRRRTCVRSRSGLDENVDISLCGAGFAREEEYCDVPPACPACVTDCAGRVDGDYPSCTSCSDYITCNRNRVALFSCATNGYVWDAFIRKCVPPPSPSCSLVKCVPSCMGLADGRYHSCFGCNRYVECRNGRDTEMTCKPGEEFNAHSGNCRQGLSPTCVRAIEREVDFLSGDAPADNYFLADDMNVEERRKLYLELRKQAGVAAKFNREDEDVFGLSEDLKATKGDEVTKKKGDDKTTTKEDKMTDNKGDDKTEITDDEMTDNEEDEKVTMKEDTMTQEKDEKEEGQSCRSDCSGVGPGMYQSCMGCRYYLICTKHGVARQVKCPRNKFWDDKRKKCKKHSRTCKGRTDVVAE